MLGIPSITKTIQRLFKRRTSYEMFRDTFLYEYRRVKARYDAAETSTENYKHWANADSYSANAAASPEIRKIIRERSRYEIKNNSYGIGATETLANDLIGTGARLQFFSEDSNVNNYIEREWSTWCDEVRFVEKCLLMRKAKIVDGEGFAMYGTNEQLDHSVKLDLALLEAEQVTTPDFDFAANPENHIDGVIVNSFGTPIEYHVLKYHPGDIGTLGFTAVFNDYLKVPAREIIHYFTPQRPRQARGIPETAPSLPLFAQLRRATLAVMRAFEFAASVAGVLKTNNPQVDTKPNPQPFELIEYLIGTLLSLPEGWDISQIKAEQPVTTYKMFKDEILCEIARCLHVPFNVIANRSDGYNYASGRLDFQNYAKAIDVERHRLGHTVLNPTLRRWLNEATVVDPYLIDRKDVIARATYKWMYPASKHVDPKKEAEAALIRRKNGVTSLAVECANEGLDWQEVLLQRKREKDLEKEYGLESNLDDFSPTPDDQEED